MDNCQANIYDPIEHREELKNQLAIEMGYRNYEHMASSASPGRIEAFYNKLVYDVLNNAYEEKIKEGCKVDRRIKEISDSYQELVEEKEQIIREQLDTIVKLEKELESLKPKPIPKR